MCVSFSTGQTTRRTVIRSLAAGGCAALGSAAGGDVAKAVSENVRLQAETLVEASTVISALVKAGKVIVAGGVFDLESGRVQPVALG
jgi:carbonic anhydrase